MPETHLSVSTDEEIAGLKIAYRIFRVYCCARTHSLLECRGGYKLKLPAELLGFKWFKPRSCKIREACVESSKFLLKAPLQFACLLWVATCKPHAMLEQQQFTKAALRNNSRYQFEPISLATNVFFAPRHKSTRLLHQIIAMLPKKTPQNNSRLSHSNNLTIIYQNWVFHFFDNHNYQV